MLVGAAARGPRRSSAALSEAASLAVALVRAGARVELAGPACAVPLGHGRAHLRRMLTELALYDADGPRPEPAASTGPRRGAAPARCARSGSRSA